MIVYYIVNVGVNVMVSNIYSYDSVKYCSNNSVRYWFQYDSVRYWYQ